MEAREIFYPGTVAFASSEIRGQVVYLKGPVTLLRETADGPQGPLRSAIEGEFDVTTGELGLLMSRVVEPEPMSTMASKVVGDISELVEPALWDGSEPVFGGSVIRYGPVVLKRDFGGLPAGSRADFVDLEGVEADDGQDDTSGGGEGWTKIEVWRTVRLVRQRDSQLWGITAVELQ
jgi:hypothetical protein